MTSAIEISVIIVTYNSSETIRDCINSVLNQSYPVKEMVIVDDGSTDSTLSIIDELAQTSPIPIIVERQSNSGPGIARNNAAKLTNFPWIAFLDSDDIWLDNRIKKQVTHLEQFPDIEFFFSNYHINYTFPNHSNLPELGVYYEERHSVIRNNIYISDYLSAAAFGLAALTSTVLISKKLMDIAGNFADYRAGEDTDLWCRIGFLGVPVLYDDSPMINYRMKSPDNLLHPVDLKIIIYQINNLYTIAIKNNKLSEFMPFAKIYLDYTIKKLRFQNKNWNIFVLVSRILLPLPWQYKTELKLRALSPLVFDIIFDLYHNTKRFLKSTFTFF